MKFQKLQTHIDKQYLDLYDNLHGRNVLHITRWTLGLNYNQLQLTIARKKQSRRDSLQSA